MPWFFTSALALGVPVFGMYYYSIRKILDAGTAVWNWERRRVRLWLVLAACYANLLPIVALVAFWIVGRDAARMLAGENRLLDYLIVYPFWFSLVIVVQIFLLLFLWKQARRLYLLVRRQASNAGTLEPKITLAISFLVVCYSCITIYADTWTIRLNETEVRLPEEFSGLDGLRIVQIADVQGDGRTTPERIRSLVEKANSLHPDIILFGGDVVTSGPKYVGSTVAVLSELKAPYGKIAAVGDHDMFSGKRVIAEGMRKAGFIMLEDSSMHLKINGVPVVITGLVYTYRQRPSNDVLAAATDNGEHRYKILLVHQPRESLVQYAHEKGYHLFLAGHTHGGAIAFGVPGLFLIAPSRFETRYFTGFYQSGGMLVSVTNGLGHTLAPIRFQAPAEVTLVRLAKGRSLRREQ